MTDRAPRAGGPGPSQSASRYTIFGQIGAGGMATIQYAEFVGPGGFSRPVAIKRLHPHLAGEANFAALFLDEARLSARIAHANVVATLDVLSDPSELSVVMEYVHGESLAGLLSIARARGAAVPCLVANNLLVGVLHGLHAAHETANEQGEPLGIVHRDVSPENVLAGSDGVARLLDFGIAKAKGRARATPSGELKGKLGYMAPEQYDRADIDRRVDVYGASVVLWQTLTGRMLFDGPSDAAIVQAVMHAEVPAPSQLRADIPAALDRLVLRGLSRDREQRFATAREMALAIERDVGIASQSEVCDFVRELAGDLLDERAAMLVELRQQVERRGHGGTRRMAQPPRAQAGEGVLTRAAAPADPAQQPTRAVTSDEAPLAARSGTRLGLLARGPARFDRRPARAFLALAFVGLLGLAAGAAGLASELHEASTMQISRTESHDSALPARKVEAHGPAMTHAVRSAAPAPLPPPTQSAVAVKKARPKREGSTAEGRPKTAGSEPPRPERARARDCTSPYEIDALGIRRWKRECL